MKSLYLSFVGLVAMMAGMMALAIIAMFGALPIHYLMKAILALYSYTLYMISIKRR